MDARGGQRHTRGDSAAHVDAEALSATPVLDVAGVSVTISGRKILDDVSFQVQSGEFTGLIGSNGVGKTTLLRTILGLQRPDAGEIRVNGTPLSRHSGSLGYVPQKVLLDPDIPIRARDFVALGLDAQRYGFKRRTKEEHERVEALLA